MTIGDVAAEAGVSPATVSRVLNDAGYPVKPETRERVLAAVAKLDFRPNELARGLLLGRTRTTGLIIPDITNPYYPALSRGVEDVASSAGYAVIFCNTDRDATKSEHYINALLQKQVDGVIIAGGGTDFTRASETFAAYRTEVVFIGRPTVPWPSVQVANVAGAAKGVDHLVSLGHREIAFLSGPRNLTSARDRVTGYRRALRRHGLDEAGAAVLCGDFTEATGYELVCQLLGGRRPPSAIFAANDRMAIGALAAAADYGLEVPRELSVVGFDDTVITSYVRPALTTIALPIYEVGASAQRLLLERLEQRSADGEAADRRKPPVVRLSADLVVRSSTAPPAARQARRRSGQARREHRPKEHLSD